MRCSHNYQQCACTASNAQLRLQAIEYLNISGLVIDFATGLVSYFGVMDSHRTPMFAIAPVKLHVSLVQNSTYEHLPILAYICTSKCYY